jgi:hypothetical protein
MAAGAALAAKRGETKPSKLIGAARQMYESMSEKQLEDFAATRRAGKPDYVERSPTRVKKGAKARAKSAKAAKRKSPAKTRRR